MFNAFLLFGLLTDLCFLVAFAKIHIFKILVGYFTTGGDCGDFSIT